MTKSKFFIAGSFISTNLFMLVYVEIIHQHESLRVFYRNVLQGCKETFISTDGRQISFLFWGDELAKAISDKRESFIVRARLILHHRQSREPPGRQSLAGGRRVRSHERIPGVESYVTVCTCSCGDNLPYKYDSRSQH